MLRSVELEAEQILSEICDRYGITLEEIKGPRRTKDIADARKEAYRTLRDRLDLSWKQIAGLLNRKSHSTALRGAAKSD